MKILWLTMDFHKAAGPYRHYYLALEESLEKIADIIFYGRKTSEEGKIPAKEIEADIVVFYAGYHLIKWEGVEKISVPKALRCTDPWANAPRHIGIINKRKIDLVLLQYPSVKQLFQERLENAKVISLPQTVNTEIFKPLNLERTYDIFQTGNCCGNYYPLRNAVAQEYGNNDKCWVKRGFTSIPSLEKYIKVINQSKILATGNCTFPVLGQSGFRMIQVKPIEALATRTLCAMDTPTCHEEMHLEPHRNFVPLELRNFRETLKYYLEHNDESEKIARRGYETFMKYHSSDVRAKQLLMELERMVNEW